ncbi:MAG: hypothetical protein Q9170_001247 [Blastenia crenularia]
MSSLMIKTPAEGDASIAPPAPPSNASHEEEGQPLSKNRLKKLRRDQAWEQGREKRKELRKLKNKEKKERKRAERDGNIPSESREEKRKASDVVDTQTVKKPKYLKSVQLPITFVIDCGFDELMMDGERKSLASQVTRSYSDNHKAPFRSHVFVSSFNGHLRERFDNVLSGTHRSWKGVKFLDGDFEEAAREADGLMKSDQGGRMAGAFEELESIQQPDDEKGPGEIVYLTSDSPDTLTELKPCSTYIIGGLVDRNRHKGICYKRAMDRGIKTAKLPIGDYMRMASRFVLATNHVVEIMLRWLEVGDWGKAFLQVIPKRKGGILKDGIMVLDKPSEPSSQNREANCEPSEDDHDSHSIEDEDEAEIPHDKPLAESTNFGDVKST